mmetsp:Transcript_13929/g.21082  ORF Transcript_13929/g.21082 Transcript_13929/m.21082 type:complete len:177 (-) Transcript_13929:56-586(-)
MPKKKSSHPSYLEMVLAILRQNYVKGSPKQSKLSKPKLAAFIEAKYKVDEGYEKYLVKAIKKGVESGDLVQTKQSYYLGKAHRAALLAAGKKTKKRSKSTTKSRAKSASKTKSTSKTKTPRGKSTSKTKAKATKGRAKSTLKTKTANLKSKAKPKAKSAVARSNAKNKANRRKSKN